MDQRLQELLDHHEITQLLAAYCQGSDRYDAERMGSIFHPDSWVDHASDHCSGAELVETAIPAQLQHTSMVWHMMGASHVKIDGDEAAAETYVVVAVRGRDDDTLNLMGGRFVDTLVRDDGKWLVKTRIQLRDWSCPIAGGEAAMFRTFELGHASQADPFYKAFGLVHSGAVHTG